MSLQTEEKAATNIYDHITTIIISNSRAKYYNISYIKTFKTFMFKIISDICENVDRQQSYFIKHLSKHASPIAPFMYVSMFLLKLT